MGDINVLFHQIALAIGYRALISSIAMSVPWFLYSFWAGYGAGRGAECRQMYVRAGVCRIAFVLGVLGALAPFILICSFLFEMLSLSLCLYLASEIDVHIYIYT